MNIATLFIFVLIILSGPVFTVLNIIKFFSKKEWSVKIEILIFGIGIFFAFISLNVLMFYSYDKPLDIERIDIVKIHAPFSKNHILTLVCLLSIGIVSYFILKIKQENISPIVFAISVSGVYIGLIVNILILLQLSGYISYEYHSDVIMVAMVIYAALFSINYTVLSVKQLKKTINYTSNNFANNTYENKFLGKLNRFVASCKNKHLLAFVSMFPLIGMSCAILVLFGQKPTSSVEVFTETCDWFFSTKVPPPPIHYQGHYLCTVALKGHKKIVKPVRHGIRHGNIILVNRQLLIANAFEDLICSKTPKVHKVIRNFYDKYGYPTSKHINSKIIADIIYITMKPLEYIFLLVLYTLDIKPEERINNQYT